MAEVCYYCKEEPSAGRFPHPRFRQQVCPTCERCFKRLNLYYRQFKLLGRVGCLFAPACLLACSPPRY